MLARLAFLPKREPYESRGMDALNVRMKRDAPEFVRRLGLRRVKGTRAIDGAYIATRLGFGAVVEMDRRAVALLVRASGLDRALRDRVGDTGPWLDGDVAEDLLKFARMRPLTRIYGRVASLTLDELEAIRPYARFLALDLPLFARALEVRFGRNAFGFGGLRIVRDRPEYGIAAAAFFARSRLRRELRTLAREFAQNRDSMLAIVGEPPE